MTDILYNFNISACTDETLFSEAQRAKASEYQCALQELNPQPSGPPPALPVPPEGIEPPLLVSKTSALSIELRRQVWRAGKPLALSS